MGSRGELIVQVRKLLERLDRGADLRETMDQVLALSSEQSGCESVGIRWMAREDYPYFLTRGFGRDFSIVEGLLCSRDAAGLILRHPDGRPQLACLCGAVISGRTVLSLPVFTESGSFWTNGGRKLMGDLQSGENPATSMRNYCGAVGYESIALMPLRSGGETHGLLQLNSRRPGRFTAEAIGQYEAVAGEIAEAMAKRAPEPPVERGAD